jgi:hypothetical protein
MNWKELNSDQLWKFAVFGSIAKKSRVFMVNLFQKKSRIKK